MDKGRVRIAVKFYEVCKFSNKVNSIRLARAEQHSMGIGVLIIR